MIQQVIYNSFDVEDERKMPAGGHEILSNAASHIKDDNSE